MDRRFTAPVRGPEFPQFVRKLAVCRRRALLFALAISRGGGGAGKNGAGSKEPGGGDVIPPGVRALGVSSESPPAGEGSNREGGRTSIKRGPNLQ